MAKIDFPFVQNSCKTIPFGATHTYTAHIREYPAPLPSADAISDVFDNDNDGRLETKIK